MSLQNLLIKLFWLRNQNRIYILLILSLKYISSFYVSATILAETLITFKDLLGPLILFLRQDLML
jgi:hypothetical protein